MMLKFPKNFLWGTATSAYQVEGGIKNCDWTKWKNAGRACDHYHRYEEDFDLAKNILHNNAHRFSIEWSRIEPEKGKWDLKEIEHYKKVLLALNKRHLKPFVTLHHFTNPLWLVDEGGWENKKVIGYFARYAEFVVKNLGQYVDFWITINEPLVYISEGYLICKWPPGKKKVFKTFKVLFNMIKAHRAAHKIIQRVDPGAKISIATNNIFFEPYKEKSFLDRFSVSLSSYFWNRYFLNKVKNHLDFIGLNYYFHNRIKFPFRIKNGDNVTSDIGWEIYPKGIYYVLKELQKYKKPIYITENGIADVKDKYCSKFIIDHLKWLHKAIQEGVDVRGYFHWSLIDNFEWAEGFEPRFGLIEIDYNNFQRKPRSSAKLYGKICQNNGI